MLKKLKGMIYGVAVGDALGVPYEFSTRIQLKVHPCRKMDGHGTYNQPAGSWSDDTSLTLCLLDCIRYKRGTIDLEEVTRNFINWMYHDQFTANNVRFDIGNSTRVAINNMKNGNKPPYGYGLSTHNGNGALMRISPLVPYLADVADIEERFDLVKEVVQMTHLSPVNYVGCHIYIEYMIQLWNNNGDRMQDLSLAIEKLVEFYDKKDSQIQPDKDEYNAFCQYHRILNMDIAELKEDDIRSTGDVIDTLEASIYCFLNTESYQGAVLKAVNLGDDTDTIAAITGSMAGLYYGFDDIPAKWVNTLLNADLIADTIEKSLR